MKAFKALFLSALLFIPATSYPAEGGKKIKIGIMRFATAKKLDSSFGSFLYAMLLEQMVSSGKYRVVDWEEIDRVLRYISKSQPNISTKAAKKQAVNQLGIQKMYVGSLTKIGKKYYITVKILNLDLTVERVAEESTADEHAFEGSINSIAKQLLMSPEEAKRLYKDERQRLKAEKKSRKGDVLKASVKTGME